ncbi:hypothetical protein EMIT07CA2_550105 [Brevibacillus sp. IT-7CA2]|uniref:hypothetical protein n=1 Tax=Brevibacillus sp. IT-7CA2 TaxID=3026436 RepID=UPI0039E09484
MANLFNDDIEMSTSEILTSKMRHALSKELINNFHPGMVVKRKKPWRNESEIGIVASIGASEQSAIVYCAMPYGADHKDGYISGAQWPQDLEVMSTSSDYDDQLAVGEFVWDDFQTRRCIAKIIQIEATGETIKKLTLLHPNGSKYECHSVFLLRFLDQEKAQLLFEESKTTYICLGDRVACNSRIITVERIAYDSYGRFLYYGQGECFREDKCKKVVTEVIEYGGVQVIDNGLGQLALF